MFTVRIEYNFQTIKLDVNFDTINQEGNHFYKIGRIIPGNEILPLFSISFVKFADSLICALKQEDCSLLIFRMKECSEVPVMLWTVELLCIGISHTSFM